MYPVRPAATAQRQASRSVPGDVVERDDGARHHRWPIVIRGGVAGTFLLAQDVVTGRRLERPGGQPGDRQAAWETSFWRTRLELVLPADNVAGSGSRRTRRRGG